MGTSPRGDFATRRVRVAETTSGSVKVLACPSSSTLRKNLKEAIDAITLGLRHLRPASEGFSLSAANADVQELPATLCR